MPENTVEPVFRRIKPITLVSQRPLDPPKKFCIDVCIGDDYLVLYLQQWLTWKRDPNAPGWEPYPLLRASRFLSNGQVAISDRTSKRELWSSALGDIPTSFHQKVNPVRNRSLGTPLFASTKEMSVEYTDEWDGAGLEHSDLPILWTLKMVVEYTR